MTLAKDTPADQSARDLITDNLSSTLFVEAGAGTGKTTALVRRVLALLDNGIAMENIAAITFTEKAAAELKYRLREELGKCMQEATGDRDGLNESAIYKIYKKALDQLDGAAISTLHGFALRILTQHAIEAGLPPRLEMSPSEGFEDRWENARSRLLNDPDHEQAVTLAWMLGEKVNKLRNLAKGLDSNWDLVEDRMGGQNLGSTPMELPDFTDLVDQFQETADLANYCSKPGDKLVKRLEAIGSVGQGLKDILATPEEVVRWLQEPKPVITIRNAGIPDDWNNGLSVKDVIDQIGALKSAVEQSKGQFAGAVLDHLIRVLGTLTLEAAEDRKKRGVLEFHDLLVLARKLLRDPLNGPGVRRALAQRYQRILIDEFQDTDPIQLELAELIATPPDQDQDWSELDEAAGRLFFVGDPQQSIYRFRRADIELFNKTRDNQNLVRPNLTVNFRTVEPIITWINDLFEELMAPPHGNDAKDSSDGNRYVQPLYVPLVPKRDKPQKGPAVVVMDTEHPKKTKVGDLRQAEANEVAETILSAISEEWSVGDGLDDKNRDRWRKARLGDICILIPSRTSLPHLESALQAHAIPYRFEAGSLIWASRMIRDVMAVIRAVANPTDEVALLNALRSPAFGCGDDDLYTFKKSYEGSWNFLAQLPENLPDRHPVGEAMAWLRELHEEVRWLSPSVLLERIVRERQLMEVVCYGANRARDEWQTIHFLLDQARQFEEAGGGGLQEFMVWVNYKVKDAVKESDFILSETDDYAVRITTIHQAKGREFPIVILSGTHSEPKEGGIELIWPSEGGYSANVNKDFRTKDYVEHKEHERLLVAAEQVRLLYVALTRAKDHLVVSAHRPQESKRGEGNLSLAQMVAVHAKEPLPKWKWNPKPLPPPDPTTRPAESLSAWQQERDAALAAAKRPSVVSSSDIAKRFEVYDDPGLDKDGDRSGDDRPTPWRKGRYGTKVGQAVHGVLETVELDASLDSLEAVADTQAEQEGVSDKKPTVRALAQSVLESNTVREAAASDHWKELFVATSVNGTVVEGYIDLLYRSADGLVVVDYKTDDIGNNETLEPKVDRYKIQVAAYALATEQAVGEPVARCVLLFAQEGETAAEIVIQGSDLASAKEDVLSRLDSLAPSTAA